MKSRYHSDTDPTEHDHNVQPGDDWMSEKHYRTMAPSGEWVVLARCRCDQDFEPLPGVKGHQPRCPMALEMAKG